MVMPIGNIKVTCLDCGWHTVIYQPSDVVCLPNQCPNCHYAKLSHEILQKKYLGLRKLFKFSSY